MLSNTFIECRIKWRSKMVCLNVTKVWTFDYMHYQVRMESKWCRICLLGLTLHVHLTWKCINFATLAFVLRTFHRKEKLIRKAFWWQGKTFFLILCTCWYNFYLCTFSNFDNLFYQMKLVKHIQRKQKEPI